MFELAMHTWYDPIQKLYEKHQEGLLNLLAPILSQGIRVGEPQTVEQWWEMEDSALETNDQVSLAN